MSLFSVGRTVIPRRNQQKRLCKTLGKNKVYYERYPFLDIYDEVTDNDILGFQRKLSIHIAFGLLLFWPLLSMPWDYVLFVKEYKRNTWNKRKMACFSATLRKICRKWSRRLCFGCILSGVVFEFLQFSGTLHFFLLLKQYSEELK